MIRMGFIGAGGIAREMAATVKGMIAAGNQEICLSAVAARDPERARAFAGTYGFQESYGSYEEMLSQGAVDLIYIATPHSHHYEHIKLCLKYGKHVLCEKAFTANAVMAEEVLSLAEEKGLLLTEAIWTRYMPSRELICQKLEEGRIGKPVCLTANLSYLIQQNQRITDPALCGGALLDVGIYPLNFADMVFGDDILKMDSSVMFFPTGVDKKESITIHYRDGRMAVLQAGTDGISDRQGIIYGERGYLVVENINNPQSLTLYGEGSEFLEKIPVPKQITGYEYEVESCIRAIREGKTECPEMPHRDTLRMLRQMDRLRQDWGLRYPME